MAGNQKEERMERNYETVCIVRPDAGAEIVKAVIQKASSAVEGLKGRVTKVEEWGRRRLAYPIRKKNEGYYFLVNYTSGPDASKELERVLKVNEDVIRYQTIRLEAGAAVKAPESGAEGGSDAKNAKE
jgi:small subunit ribosomal protein S6